MIDMIEERCWFMRLKRFPISPFGFLGNVNV